MERLTVAQREGIRCLALDDDVINYQVLRALERRGLAQPPAGHRARWSLTEAGHHAHERIMASGDGPEALKELLRF